MLNISSEFPGKISPKLSSVGMLSRVRFKTWVDLKFETNFASLQ